MIVEPGKCPKAFRLLAMLILRDQSPTVGYSIHISNLSADLNWLHLVFPLIFAQVSFYKKVYQYFFCIIIMMIYIFSVLKGEELGHIAAHVPIFIKLVSLLSIVFL